MKYFFVLGRNPMLSIEEIFSYLKARGVDFKQFLLERGVLCIETKEKLKINIENLGGTVLLGEIIFEGLEEEFIESNKTDQLFEKDKFSYMVFGNCDISFLKAKFKKNKQKAVFKPGRGQIITQEGDAIGIGLADYYLCAFKKDKKLFFGISFQKFNAKEIEGRDMLKPVRRPEYAISPRLAKILINLSFAKEGDFLLDLFCGVGGILQEAMLQGINVMGIDKDKKAIENARKNLYWISKKYKLKPNFTLLTGNASTISGINPDSIATESPFGDLFRHKPSKREANEAIEKFERLIIPVLKNLKRIKKENSRIAITFPIIWKKRTNAEYIAKKSGTEIVLGPIIEKRDDQYVSRDFLVFV